MDTLPVYLYNEEINKLLIDYYILCNSKQLINTEQLVAILEQEFKLSEAASEFLFADYWDRTYNCKGILLVAKGVSNRSYFNYSDIMRSGILVGASSFSLVHNHPNRNLTFSLEDCNTTKYCINLGKILNMPLHEHILIADNKYTTLKGGDFNAENE